jgi:hypothetical protein
MKTSLFLASLIISSLCFAQKTKVELERELLDFSNLKKVLENDSLEAESKRKLELAQAMRKETERIEMQKYSYPDDQDFWPFMTELWLIKNAAYIKWDINKPDYGLDVTFSKLLQSLGFVEKSFRILLHNNPDITHFALPYGRNNGVYMVSIPFIRAMDLTKVEIALMMLEDFLRLEDKYFVKKIKSDISFLATSTKGAAFNQKHVNDVLIEFSELIKNKGYSFQEQFEVTKKMSSLLKSEPNLYSSYISLLKKIETIIKENQLFSNHIKLYPSPQMQLRWLSSKK